MKDPLNYYYSKIGFDASQIKNIVWGDKYTAVLLNNGNIGVCANLEHTIKADNLYVQNIEDRTFRIVYNAFLNAIFNYKNIFSETIDIFQAIEFEKIKRIVMIGFFGPLYEKFEKAGIELEIFDKFKKGNPISEIDQINKSLFQSDAVILTATSIANHTFYDIISQTKKANIYLLGPSCILDKDLFQYKNIAVIFGTVFKKNDQRILEIISNNGGSREFLKFGRKVLLHENS